MKIIFLDIDGVLNCENGYRNDYCKYVDWVSKKGAKEHHQAFYPKSKDLLNKLIKETGAKIVITSTWRFSGIEFIRGVWEQEKMEGEIIGMTPALNFRGGGIKIFDASNQDEEAYTIPRGCEIEYWLKVNKFSHIYWSTEFQQESIDRSGIENYIIIDDDSDMLYGQRQHFIHVLPSPRNKEGFNESHYKLALMILEKDIFEMNEYNTN